MLSLFWLPHLCSTPHALSLLLSFSYPPSLNYVNKENESFKMFKDSSQGRMLFLDPRRRKQSLWVSENGAIFLWRDRASFQSSAQDPPRLTTDRQPLSQKSLVLRYLRYRNGCVFLGKYAAYTVSMAFLKAADSTRRSEKTKGELTRSHLSSDEVTAASSQWP